MNWIERTDGELVAAFANDGADEAFAELVRRHATMVFRTCRRVTGSHQDAEDATQAVFATVIVRARDLGNCRSLGGWLYSAAWHVSRRYRRSELTRRHRERRATPVMPVHDGDGDQRDPELSAELYRAIEMLPADYRDAVVLHHLEGCTIQQVAELTGSPVGTTAARVSRGRAMLRERLDRRGILMSEAMLTTFVMGDLLREPVAESIATRAAMAGAAMTATEAASTATAVATAAGTAATLMAARSAAVGPVLYAGLQFRQWVAAACVATLLGGGTVAVGVASSGERRGVANSGRTRTAGVPSSRERTHARQTESASIELTSRSAGDKSSIWYKESSSNVPEPSCLSVLAAGGLLLRRTRRRAPAG
jgi:RNA polymerase sigma factor (sigma-70 family)